jgi:antitoxin PrlF
VIDTVVSEFPIFGKAEPVSRTTVRGKGQVTIPADIRAQTQLEEGDPVEVEVVADGILLRPGKVVDATQAWFWTPAWQAGEREAADQLASGEGTTYESDDEFLASFDE